MKTSLIAVIAIAIGIVIVVSGVSYQEVYNQNCIEDDGKVTGFLRCTRIFEDFSLPLSKYDIEYDDLVTRKVWAFAIPAKEIIPERNCHKFSQLELANLPSEIKYVIDESLPPYPFDFDNNGFYDGFQNPVPFDVALPFLERYDFHLTTKIVDGSTLPKLQDTQYDFECIFEDDNKQYKLGFTFESHYAGYGRLVFVNFTNNDKGLPIVENNNITLFDGGFNHTVVFNNDLNHDIVLEIINPSPRDDSYERNVPEKTPIPSGKVWSHFFRNDNPNGDLVYQFNTKPDNLHGIIILKKYPRCMSENEVSSLYSQVEAYPRFPSYLPDGYTFECGVHNMNSFVHLIYFTDELRQKFEDKTNSAFDKDFFASGGIRVDYYNEFITSNFNKNPDYNKFEKAKENAEHPWAKTLTIAGEPAVMIKEYFWNNGTQKSFNYLMIFLDNEIYYTVRSGLPENEIIKIAESLF